MTGRERQPFLFVGNHLCLDFVNTQMIVKGTQTDLLETFDDLISWLVLGKVLTKSQSEAARAELNHKQTHLLLEQAKSLRATCRIIAERLAAGKTIPDSAIDTINRFLSQRPGYLQLIRTKGAFEQRFHSEAAREDSLLAPLAEAACALLCLPDPAMVKKCGNAACILYFYDTTKNHRRTWCSMQLCGNRMKVAAYFQRQRDSSTQ